MTTNNDTRLYGTPGAEVMELDIATAYETQIEPWIDETSDHQWQIEEWTVAPKRQALPSVHWLIEAVTEHLADDFDVIDDVHFERIEDAAPLALAEQFLAAWADAVKYESADKLVATYAVTWDDDGEPLVNGLPLYRPREDGR